MSPNDHRQHQEPPLSESRNPHVTFTYDIASQNVGVSGDGNFPIPHLINALSQTLFNLHAQQAQIQAREAAAQQQKRIVMPNGFPLPPKF